MKAEALMVSAAVSLRDGCVPFERYAVFDIEIDFPVETG